MTKPSGHLAIIPAAAVFDHRLSHADVRVLAALGAHADKQGRCWPAVPTLAQKIGLSERHVHRCLQTLSKCGVVEIEKRPGRSSIYRIPMTRVSGVGGGTHDMGVRDPGHGCQGTLDMGVTQKDTKKDTKKETVASLPTRQFEIFWRTYPSRRPHSNPKKPARAKFEAAVKRGVAAADIIRGAEHYGDYVEREHTDAKYVAQAKTWLNEERWTQYKEAAVTEPTPIML